MLVKCHSYFSQASAGVAQCLRLMLLVLFTSISTILVADEWENTKYNTTEGTEFYATFLKNQGSTESDSDNLTLYLHAASEEGADVTVTYLLDGTSDEFRVNPKSQKTIKIKLSKAYVDFIPDVPAEDQISKRGIFVTSTKPISLYITNSRSGAYGGTCVLPEGALEREYVVQTYYGDHESTMFAIVGTADGTNVKLRIKKTELDKELYEDDDIIKVDTIVYEDLSIKLNEGEVFMYRSGASYKGLSGTTICADRPIAVFNGHQASRIPYYDETINHLSAQTYPTDKWGKRYVVTPTKNYKNKTEHVRITAFSDNTKISKNGRYVCTLKALDTYQDTINGVANYYECSNTAACFLYTLGKQAEGNENNKAARPSMTPIIPLEYATQSLLFATFTESEVVQNHYVNIVVPGQYANSMYMDGQRLNAQYSTISVDGKEYKYAQVPVSPAAHYLENKNVNGAFTARVYGMGSKKGGGESYAYSAGSRANRAVDMLIDGENIYEKRICINDKVDFTSLINFDYDYLRWEIEDETLFTSNDSIVNDYLFSKADTNEVRLYVYSRTPICENVLEDVVTARIIVDTLNYRFTSVQQCYGGSFEFEYKGQDYTISADTVTEHIVGDRRFKFELNKYVVLEEIIPQVNSCDLRLRQAFIVRPTYDHQFDTLVCDQWVWLDTVVEDNKQKIITIKKFDIQPSDKLPVTKQFSHSFTTIHGCDSTVTWRVTLNKSYHFEDSVAECQMLPGGKYTWPGHTSVSIPLDVAGEYTYHDDYKTTKAPHCDSTYTLKVTVYPRYDEVEEVTISNEDYMEWQGMKIGGADSKVSNLDYVVTKNDTIVKKHTTINGCDSIYELRIRFGIVYRDTTRAAVCDNESKYEWYRNGKLFKTISPLPTKDTTYMEKRQSPIGIDSIFYLNLTLSKAFYDTLQMQVCENSGYTTWSVDKADVLDIKANKWIKANEIPTDKEGWYEYQGTNHAGCDSIWRLHVELIKGYRIDTAVSMCDDDTIVWQNRIYQGIQYSAGLSTSMPVTILSDTINFVDSVSYTSKQGCDSVMRIIINVHPSYHQVLKIDTNHICDNESYTFLESVYNANGEWKITDKKTHTHTLQGVATTINGCDSAIMHIVYVHPTYDDPIVYDTICESALPYNYPDSRALKFQGLSQSGEYTDIIPSINGCDSVIHLHLTIHPSAKYTESVTWCQSAGPYSFASPETPRLHNLTKSGIYVDTLKTIFNQYGCDSIIEINLTILDSIVVPIYDSICDNELPYNFSNPQVDRFMNLTQSGVYRDTLTAVNGCDSVLVLHLQVNKTYNTTDTIYICNNEENPYIWRPKDRNGTRAIPIPFTPDHAVNVTNKETIILKDSSVMLESIHGCDSLVNLYLVVYPTYKFVQEDSVCQDTIDRYYTWIDQQGGVHDSIDISKSGWLTVGDTLKTQHGCDSIFGIQLYIKPIYLFDSVYTICQDERIDWQGRGYTGDQYGWNFEILNTNKVDEHRDSVYYAYKPGDRILQSGVYYDTVRYTTVLGCDSTYCLTLNVLPSYNTIIEATACESDSIYVFAGGNSADDEVIVFRPMTNMIDSTMKDTTFYTSQRILKSVNGCDSTVYLHLTVYPSYEYVTHAQICEREVYEWRGKQYTKTGVYYDSLYTNRGCDSTYVLELYVKPVYYITRTVHACDNQTVMHADTMWYGPDSVRFAIDSTLLWKPGMLVPNPDETREVRYRSWDNTCDSIVFCYHIYIYPTYDSIADVTLCSNDSYQLHDSYTYKPVPEYYEPGSVYGVLDTLVSDTLQTSTCLKCDNGGCDSIFTAKIHVLPAYKHMDSATICSDETFRWRGRDIHQAWAGGYYYADSLLTQNTQCDSIYELYLTVCQAYDHDVFDTICADEYYQFGDKALNQSGMYLDTLRTIHNCDSIVHLYLTVLDTTIVETYDTICVTEKYYYFGQEYTEPGVYDTITLNDWGCKQYNYLYLEVIDTTKYEIAIGDVLCADDEELVVEYEWLSGRRLIEYSVFFDDFGHSQGFEDIVHAPLDPTLSYFTIPIPRGDDLPKPPHAYFDSSQGVNSYVNETKQNYPEPNIYTMRVVMHNGICGDSLQRKDTTISFWYPSWIHEQHWNDVIMLYNEEYNGGYVFSKYQWYQNGKPLPGATGEYLYLPEQLLMNQPGDCSNYYQVELTRADDGYTTMTCPICPVLVRDAIVPNDTYFSVVPTAVPKANPVIHFLASHAGTYRICTMLGEELTSGRFIPDANNYAGNKDLSQFISGTNMTLLVEMVQDTGECRTIKVIIGN